MRLLKAHIWLAGCQLNRSALTHSPWSCEIPALLEQSKNPVHKNFNDIQQRKANLKS